MSDPNTGWASSTPTGAVKQGETNTSKTDTWMLLLIGGTAAATLAYYHFGRPKRGKK